MSLQVNTTPCWFRRIKQTFNYYLSVIAARPTTSVIVTGEGLKEGGSKEDAEKIHMENMDRLSSMSEAEIIQEQQKLLESLGMCVSHIIKKQT